MILRVLHKMHKQMLGVDIIRVLGIFYDRLAGSKAFPAKVAQVATLLMLLIVSGCSDPGVPAEQCWNSKLLRVKVGKTILDLPSGVDIALWEGGRPDGLLDIKFDDWKGNRLTCQRKDRVPLDYGPRVKISMRDRPAKRDYIIGSLYDYNDASNQIFIDFSQSLFRDLRGNPPFISKYTDAGNSVFVGSFPNGRYPEGKSRLYIFSEGPREYITYCQIWTYTPAGSAPRSPSPFSCIPGWRFSMGDLIVAFDARAELLEPETGRRVVAPPDMWPRKWAAVLEEISNYRVNPGMDEQP